MIDPSLPLLDLHRHLDGSFRLETVVELAELHGVELPARDVEGLRPHVVIDGRESDLMSFIGRMHWLVAALATPEACRRVAREVVLDAAVEGLDYVELRFSPLFMAEPHGLDPAAVVEAVVDGVEAGSRESGLRVGLIGILSRTYGVDGTRRELEALLSQHRHLVALDLAGDEARFPAALFVEHFKEARELGLGVTVHAGEAAGPESMWSAIRDLGATRIGHALCALQDPALLDYMVEHRIGVEANLTSNVQTSSVSSYAVHPLAEQLRRGVLATLNTDDPTISGIDLAHEYEVAAPRAGLDPGLIRQAQKNALEIAFLGEDARREVASRPRV